MSRPRDPHCLFCKIVAGDLPSARVLEADDAVAFLDIHPVNLGHVLVATRAHYPVLAELPAELAASASALLPQLCRAVQAATGSDGINVIVNMGRAAGQTIDHVHWHIIPRFIDDTVNWPWPHSEYVGDSLGQMQFRIQRELNPPSDD
ncbi:MAG TPA: HIT domain-containing protein [Isosphaeraceae bacterium]|nr:HIT domain-containing protein [Isosphaeraceae bacterium]